MSWSPGRSLARAPAVSLLAAVLGACSPEPSFTLADLGGVSREHAPPWVVDAIGRTWYRVPLVAGDAPLVERLSPPWPIEAGSGLLLLTAWGGAYGTDPREPAPRPTVDAGGAIAGDSPEVADAEAPDPAARVLLPDDGRGDLDEGDPTYANVKKLMFNVRNARGVATTDVAECSGVAVTNTLVLTAAHCLMERGVALDPANPGRDEGIRVCADRSVPDRYDNSCDVSTSFLTNVDWAHLQFADDWALVQTSNPINGFNGAFALAPAGFPSRVGQVVNHAGFPGARSSYPAGVTYPSGVRDFGCRVKMAAERRLSYDCDTAGGQSGGPVWVKEEDGDRFIVAVHAGSGATWNTGARISFWRSEIDSAIAGARVGGTSNNGSRWQGVAP